MSIRLLWLGVVGTVVLAIGMYLAIAKRAQFYPGLLIVFGCVAIVVFTLVNHDPWDDHA